MRRANSSQQKSAAPSPAPTPPPADTPVNPERYAARMSAFGYYFPRLRTRVAPSDDDIDGLARLVGARPPAAYEAFLRRYGRTGALARLTAPVADADWRRGDVPVEVFYGFDTDGAYDVCKAFRTYAERIPKTMLPIASTPGGDQICVGVDGEERGAVYLWSHEHPRKTAARDDDGPWWHCVYRMAPSFEHFFDSLVAELDPADEAALAAGAAAEDPERAAVLRSQKIEDEVAAEERRGAAVRDALVQLTEDEAEIGLVLGVLARGERRKLRRVLGNIARAEERTVDLARLERAVCAAWDGVEMPGRGGTPAAVAAVAVPAGPVRVRHRVFGEGVLVRELEANKVEVRFDSVGSKVLIRTVLEFLQ